jgi:RND family efflux transporter MFP subunit
MRHNESSPTTGGETVHAETHSPQGKRGAVIAGLFFLLIMIGIAAGIVSRVGATANLHDVAAASAAPMVIVVHPASGNLSDEIDLPGNTQAYNDTAIYARTSGYVKHWSVDIGDHVKRGQLLATIETPELDQQLEQARADLTNAEANLKIADITATRWQNLLKSKSVSQQETDQAVSDLSSKQALVASSKANVDRLTQLQSFERVTAPFDGVITARNTDIGALIQSGDNTTPKELFHLASIQTLRVYIPVPEIYAPSVKSGEKVEVTIDAFPKEMFEGAVVRNSDAIDLTSRTLNVEVDMKNPAGRLFPGAYAFVHFKVPSGDGTVTIPTNALLFRSEGLRASVVKDGRVKLTPITIGRDYGNSVEVVSGLSLTDAVIINPSDSLIDGAAVRTREKENGTVHP